MTANRVLYVAAGVLAGLVLAQMLGVESLTARLGIGAAA